MYRINIELNDINNRCHEVEVEFARRHQAEEMEQAFDDLLFEMKCSGAIGFYEVEMQEVK